MRNCLHCGVQTPNPKYCSRSCAAKETNKVPKRKAKSKFCKHCNTPIPSRHTICDQCRPGLDMTLQEAMYLHLHKSSAFAKVRTRARASVSDRPQVCISCGYDKHVEVCHIKGISSFSPDTLISVVNAPDNLALLCPNCHWEFDKGLLAL